MFKKLSLLMASVFLITSCSSQPVSNSGRSLASEVESAREIKFTEMMQSPQASKLFIAHVDKVFDLLIEINSDINKFDKELDLKLANKKANPKAKIEEPLKSPTYARLWKMWQIKDKYTDEVAWHYSELLKYKNNPNLNPEDAAKVQVVHANFEKYLASTRDAQRVELQPLMQELSEISTQFTQEKPAYSNSIFKNEKELKTYLSKQRMKSMPISSPASMARRQAFLAELNQEMAAIPDLVIADREPQSQDLSCSDGKKICASASDSTGNIIGKVFPPGVWTLTYDDGPKGPATGELLKLLRSYSDPVNTKLKVTFFWLAQQAPKFPQYVEQAAKDGHSLQNHSYSHANLALKTTDRTREIIQSTKDLTAIYQKYIPGHKIQYFRCPYGSCYAPKVPEARQMIANLGQVHAYWRIDSLDWKLMNGPKIADLVIKQMQLQDHGVILMHDIHTPTVEATRLILQWLKKQNSGSGTKYRLVTLPEAIDMVNGQ